MISVILATYNRAEFIKRAIESVLSQSYKDFEFIIVNDACQDDTLRVLKSYNDSRIKIINNEINLGFVKSLNKAINYAKGKYIARIDDDDYWIDKDKLLKQVKFLEDNQDCVLVGCGGIKIDNRDKELKKFLFPKEDEEIRKMLLITNPFIHASVVYLKEAWEKVNGYDESLKLSQDFDLWAKLGKIGKMHNIQDYGVKFTEHSQSRMNQNIHKHILLKQKVRKRYRKDYPYFYRSYILGWIIYLISFLPFQRKIRSFLRDLWKIEK